jgi:hypothetical protein
MPEHRLTTENIDDYLTSTHVMQRLGCSRTTAIRFMREHGGFKLWNMWWIHRKKLEAAHD